jgi:hypothetical protein
MFKTGLIGLLVTGGLLFSLSAAIEASQPAPQATETVDWFNRLSTIPIKG